jgi:hypothetical protein
MGDSTETKCRNQWPMPKQRKALSLIDEPTPPVAVVVLLRLCDFNAFWASI